MALLHRQCPKVVTRFGQFGAKGEAVSRAERGQSELHRSTIVEALQAKRRITPDTPQPSAASESMEARLIPAGLSLSAIDAMVRV
jgi:hypothetical protein